MSKKKISPVRDEELAAERIRWLAEQQGVDLPEESDDEEVADEEGDS